MNTTDQIIRQCKEALTKQYGERLKGVILYGARTRGQPAQTAILISCFSQSPRWIISLNYIDL
jgi:hypothetical protein